VVLRWLREQVPPCPWDEDTCSWAADVGRIDVLQFARAQSPPCPWNEEACASAASGGDLEVLRWLREQTPPCPWDYDFVLGQAEAYAERGQPYMLRWMRDHA